ncbi:MAG: Maf family protein [Acidimicrobiia bacterium]
MTLVLASASPRRAELLRVLGLGFETQPADLDETRLPDEPAAAYVERLARAKAEAVAGTGLTVVAADTTVVHEGRVLGKPAHPEEARAMLRRLQGDVHEVFTGVAVAGWDGGSVVRSAVDVAKVEFLAMTEDEIAEYVDTGEPMDKAGSYALQGLGGLFVRRIDGSPFTVIGLPIHLLPRLFAAVGSDLWAFQA